jgi:D-tyrosyl-tRNA(Tyr) deacylase
MRVVLQRVKDGSVTVDGLVVGRVGTGYVALVGITHADTPAVVGHMARKVALLRVFDDDAGKMNRSLLDIGGGVLVVSQFTLYADASGGRRPSYIAAARPEQAAPLVDAFVDALRREGVAHVETGVFGAMMQVSLVNDGPVTILLDSDDAVRV